MPNFVKVDYTNFSNNIFYPVPLIKNSQMIFDKDLNVKFGEDNCPNLLFFVHSIIIHSNKFILSSKTIQQHYFSWYMTSHYY